MPKEQHAPRSNGPLHNTTREACLCLCVYALFFLWWYLTAYGWSELPTEPLRLIFGMPRWFFLSCVVGYLAFSVCIALITRYCLSSYSFDMPDNTVSSEQDQ